MRHSISAVLLALLLAGCAVGPNYKRPPLSVPDTFRGASADSKQSIADRKWFELFQDDVLTQLVETALRQNFDLRIATERVLEDRARFGIARANQFPFADVNGQFNAIRNSSIGSFRFLPRGTPLDVSYTQAGFSVSWELDLWGRLRRLTESSRAQYLATEEARNGVIVTLLADVLTGYLTLREQDQELDIARKTRDIAADNLRLIELRHRRGAATGLDVSQAEQFLYTATSQIANIERALGQTIDSLSFLLGNAPADIPRGKTFSQFTMPPQLPAGLPSSLLMRRPDIRQAEQVLIAANAQIGAARAQLFPQISLTGFLGGQSRALTDIVTGPGRYWIITPSLLLPIFHAGQIRSGIQLSEAQQREMVATYQKTIYNALREVADALIAYDRTREQRSQQELLVGALAESDRLSKLRYRGGIDSYLQVLDAERNLFQGQLALSQLQLQEFLSVVQLYRALGGGWQ